MYTGSVCKNHQLHNIIFRLDVFALLQSAVMRVRTILQIQ